MHLADQIRELAGADRAFEVVDGQLAFERLEWIGDSVLDVLVARHLCCTVASAEPRFASKHSMLVRDETLTKIACRLDLPKVRASEHPTARDDFDPQHRQGDSVEAWIGAAWFTGGWESAAEATRLLVLPGSNPAALLSPMRAPDGVESHSFAQLQQAVNRLGWDVPDPGWLALLTSPIPARRRLVYAGAFAVELAASSHLLEQVGNNDENRLSGQRIALTSGEALRVRAKKCLAGAPRFPNNHRLLQAVAGAALLGGGPATGLTVADALLFS